MEKEIHRVVRMTKINLRNIKQNDAQILGNERTNEEEEKRNELLRKTFARTIMGMQLTKMSRNISSNFWSFTERGWI